MQIFLIRSFQRHFQLNLDSWIQSFHDVFDQNFLCRLYLLVISSMFEIILNMLQINTAKGILDTILSVQPKESAGGKAGDTR